MIPSESSLYDDFVDRLLYADTLKKMREAVEAEGVAREAVVSALDTYEANARRQGWLRTLELTRFVRAQLGDLLLPKAAPTQVVGAESLLKIASKTVPAMLPGLLRQHRQLLSRELLGSARSAALRSGRNLEPGRVLVMFAIARTLRDKDSLVEAILVWSSFQRSRGDLDRAIRHLLRAERESSEAGSRAKMLVMSTQAGTYRVAALYAEAIQAFEQCAVLSDSDMERLAIVEAIADCYRGAGMSAQAVDACTRGLDKAEEMQAWDRVIRLLELRGLCGEDLGDYEAGRSDYLRAAQLAEQTGDRGAQLIGMNNAAASLLKRGLVREGYRAFRHILRVVEDWGNPIMVASTYNNLGQALLKLERYVEARVAFGQSLSLRLNTGHHAGEVISFIGLGDVAVHLEDNEGAQVLYTMALIPALESGDEGALLNTQIRLADIEANAGGPALVSAIQSLREAREHLRHPRDIGFDALVTLKISQLLDESGDSASALDELERLIKGAGAADTRAIQLVRTAHARLLTMDSDRWCEGFALLQALLKRVEERLDESLLDARRSEIVGETVAIHAAMLRALASPSAPTHLQSGVDGSVFAFDLHEAAKSRSTLVAMARASVPAPAAIPAELREKEEILLRRDRVLQESREDTDETTRLRHMAETRAELTSCWNAMRATAPEYVRFRSAEPATHREISAWLDGQAQGRCALLSLFCDEDGIEAFVLRKGEPRPKVFRLPIPRKRLDFAVRRLQRAFNGDPQAFPPYPPIRGNTPHKRPLDFLDSISSAFDPVWDAVGEVDLVCVAPHGPLHLLPLHALKTQSGFVAQRFAVTYTPALSLLLQTRPQPPQYRTQGPDWWPKVLAVGVSSSEDAHPAFFEQDAALFDSATWSVTELTGVIGASREWVLRQLSGHDIVHISCHGYFDGRNPLNSGLVLSNGKTKAPRDLSEMSLLGRHEFLLTVEDLMAARFEPSLVTLSACSSGLQHVRNGGDELDGFGRALLMAGAPTAVLSMWNIDQVSSTEFFRTFYGHLSTGVPKWKALNATQRDMIDNGREAWQHPYHWAPYFLLGDWRSL